MKTLISIIGTTGIGKTKLAIEIAKHFDTEIISCDSRQFFREMKIGTATPSCEGEARTNDLFAARLFLKRMGLPTTRKDALLSLPDTNTVIVLNTGRYTLTPQKTQALLAWVAAGGHLVTRARVDYASETELEADEENQQKPETEDRDALQQALQVEIGASQLLDEEDLPFSLQLARQPKPLQLDVSFFNELLTNNPAAKSYQAKQKNFLLQIPQGQGLISLAATLEFVENHPD